MREMLSDLIVETARNNEKSIVLSGDHGYALFDAIRSSHPRQFINVGVMEQAMVGIAAGLAKTGFQPIVYGLAAFIPIRVLEQIKLDVCYSNLPVIFLGDGAGLVYSTLGSSHQCGEDLACLRPLTGMRIYTPADKRELKLCFDEALASQAPCYIRIGKSDRPPLTSGNPVSTAPYFTTQGVTGSRVALVSIGSMTSLAHEIAASFSLPHLSVMRLKPWHSELVESLKAFDHVIALEEHNRVGGLASALSDAFMEASVRPPLVHSISLKDQFADKCGSWQYAMSEHGLADQQVRERISALVKGLSTSSSSLR